LNLSLLNRVWNFDTCEKVDEFGTMKQPQAYSYGHCWMLIFVLWGTFIVTSECILPVFNWCFCQHLYIQRDFILMYCRHYNVESWTLSDAWQYDTSCLQEMLLLLLPLLNSSSVKKFLLPFSKDKSAGSFGDEADCPICRSSPSIPFIALPCQHRYAACCFLLLYYGIFLCGIYTPFSGFHPNILQNNEAC
jgi:hypothetical protein